METIFDIGMYDGGDTAYYLESGYRVIAVEANPELAKRATQMFAAHISSGQLTCVNAAISPTGEPVELLLCGDAISSSSVFKDQVADMQPIGSITVPGLTLGELFKQYGIPKYLKVDIEGSDRYCVLSLTAKARPQFLSFEIGEDVDELMSHAAMIGYTRFKIINQNSFREVANMRSIYDRLAHRMMRYMGYAQPGMIWRAGRFFRSGHSSGPVPWKSDGHWRSADAARALLRGATLPGWNDVHATSD